MWFLVFEVVVLFGVVIFGVLFVVAGFLKVFASWLTRLGKSDAHAVAILLPRGHWEGFLGRDFG